MKYANKFQNQAAYNTWKSGSSYVTPNVGLISSTGELIYQKFINSNGHDYVDLGLPSGTLWATMNIGASEVYQMGDYFAWGETSPKSDYSWETYAFGTDSALTKYNASDGKRTLDLSDDAAHVLWGGSWHIPSPAQIQELCYYINSYSDNGNDGYQSTINENVVWKWENSNDNGIAVGTVLGGAGSRHAYYFMSNTLETGGYLQIPVFHDEGEGWGCYDPEGAGDYTSRCHGFQVRAVIGTLDIFAPPYQSIPR